MSQAFEEISDATLSCPDNSGEGAIAPRCWVSPDGFLWQQLSAVGLVAVAEKVAAGRDLDLEEALLLSRASLPLLAVLITLRRDVVNFPNASCEACDTAEVLPIERSASPPQSPRGIGQAPTDWESFCRTLIATRGEVASSDSAIFWYPIVEQPLDRDLGRDDSFSGVDILRAIALARLVLPAAIEVRAPLATLGPKLALVALEFGASHLGYVAPDGQTPNDPLVADPSVFEELLRSCQPTLLKEEA